MKYLILCLLLLLSACNPKEETYKTRKIQKTFKVGDIITIPNGYYQDCHLRVVKVNPPTEMRSYTIYNGESDDCPPVKNWAD